ncbi:MAG: hypothetical protein FWD17_08605 [Polyangiaceae bacterium]|nr:hypothetical protein [Polyangiaceae bacterium]
MAKKKSPRKDRPRARSERRFEALATTRPWVAYALGAVGAVAMGAGTWGELGSALGLGTVEPLAASPYLLATGALVVAAAIWLGTSGEPALRVGDAGVGVERGGVRRVPWYAIERIEWRDEAVRVTGQDENGAATTLVAKLTTQPQAGAWIVKEARERVPAVVDVPADATLPEANANAGALLPLEPPQVVGRHCAASGQVISFEPDARVCSRCERVYHKAHVPETCACGASLAELRSAAQAG